MILSLVTTLLLLVVVLSLVVATTVLPFVLTVDMAERRGYSTFRWGTIELAALAVAAAMVWKLQHHSILLLVLPLEVCWLAPELLSLLTPQQSDLGGVQGAHEA
jgi:uncharacterized membrane protein YadS